MYVSDREPENADNTSNSNDESQPTKPVTQTQRAEDEANGVKSEPPVILEII